MPDMLRQHSALRGPPPPVDGLLQTPARAVSGPAEHGCPPSAAVPWLDPLLAAPTDIDRSTSRRLGRAVRAQAGHCYENALCALPRLANGTSVEGVVVTSDGLQFDHAWLETTGRVVDPTPSYLDLPDGDCTYFAGPRWTRHDIMALFPAANADLLTPILRPGDTSSPEREAWIAAKVAAFRHASPLHLRQSGRPAIAAAEHHAMLEGLLGSYWARWVLQISRTNCAPTDTSLNSVLNRRFVLPRIEPPRG